MRRCHWDPSSILFIGHHQNDERHHGTLLQFCHGNDPSLISTAANDGKLIHSFEQSALEVQNVALRLDAKLQLVLDSSGYYYYNRLPWLRNYKKFTVPLPPLNSPVRNTNLTIWTIINYLRAPTKNDFGETLADFASQHQANFSHHTWSCLNFAQALQ